jgi:hypothetical protein
MNQKQNPTEKISSRPTFACIRCAERKVKCDRQRPCSTCTKHNADCVFNATKSPRKKHKRVKVQVLADRLHQYEALLQKHGIDQNELLNTANLELPSRPGPIVATHQEPSLRVNHLDKSNEDLSNINSSSRYEFTNLNIVEK